MDIDDDLEPLTVYSYDVSPRLDALVRHVLKRIPTECADEFPSFSVCEAPSKWGAHVDGSTIIFDPSLIDGPRDVAIGTLAHEFAHVFCRHDGKGGLKDEDEADRTAREWGFVSELAAMRQRFGPTTEV